ncbi:MAG: tripartite tricarboxylate transporter TctB family protein [Tetrasphaera sp.]
MTSDSTLAPRDAEPGVGSNRAEYGVVALLLVMGLWAILATVGIEDRAARGFVTAKTLPIAVGIMLIATAVFLAIDIARGGHGEQEEGEDVDLSHGSDFRTVALLVAAFAFNAALIESIGWPITGAVMFFLCTVALGGRHYLRTALIAVILSFGSWYLFYLALGINLPLGLLDGVL